ncbi:MAG: radical SAM protein [Candidatus Altiarchaeota archaeon]|nr:radical SAM protein [Candidatus Altiarchaeota archaeon]
MEERPRILLVAPAYYSLFNVDKEPFIPLGLLYVAGMLKSAGYAVRVYDMDVSFSSFRRGAGMHASEFDYGTYRSSLDNSMHYSWVNLRGVIKEYRPDVVGVGSTVMTYSSALKTAQAVKEMDGEVKIVAGGVYPTLNPDGYLNAGFDAVVRGEGDYSMLELVQSVEDGGVLDSVEGVSFRDDGVITHNSGHKMVEDLDELPFPARDSIAGREQYNPAWMGNVVSGRGCPFRCHFCSCNTVWGGMHRFRSPENFVDEIQSVRKEFGTKLFYFEDDTFYFDEERVWRICELIREGNLDIKWNCLMRGNNVDADLVKEMKKAGLVSVSIGVESGSQEMLDRMNKGIRVEDVREEIKTLNELGIDVRTNFMIGYPGETKETLAETEALISELDTKYTVELFGPLPGTEVYGRLEKEGKMLEHEIDDYNDYYKPIFQLDSLEWDYLVKKHVQLREKAKRRLHAR